MEKLNNSNSLINFSLIITVVSFIAAAFLIVAVLWPKFQELETVRQDVEEAEEELQGEEEYLLRISGAKNKLEEYETELAKIDSAIPKDPSIPSLFDYIQKISSESGLILNEIGAFSFTSSKDLAGLNEIVFSIEVYGSYSSFKDFLSVMENSARIIEAESISFSLSEERGEFFKFGLKLKAYSY